MLKIISLTQKTAAEDLRERMHGTYATILADPPWQFQNRTGKMAPEHHRMLRYSTMTLEEIMELPVPSLAAASSHLYLSDSQRTHHRGTPSDETLGIHL